MRFLLRCSRMIDRLNELIGRSLCWLILVAVVVSAGNATVRYALDTSSNAWLELQWYLFSAVFLLCAGYTLLRNEHVRIDILSNHFPRRTQIWIDIVGSCLFLLPMAVLIGVLSWPVVVDAYVRHEVSSDAGGLLRWPARILVPIGFLLLSLQGISELIKRVGYLLGLIPDPVARPEHPLEEAPEAMGRQPT